MLAAGNIKFDRFTHSFVIAATKIVLLRKRIVGRSGRCGARLIVVGQRSAKISGGERIYLPLLGPNRASRTAGYLPLSRGFLRNELKTPGGKRKREILHFYSNVLTLNNALLFYEDSRSGIFWSKVS